MLETGLPPDELWQSLALFNIGVELAQLAVVILPFVILQYGLRGSRWFPAVSTVVSLAVAGFGLYLLQGAFGLPVFQGTPEKGLGMVYMMGPTGGYLAGFFVAAVVCG